MDRALAAQALGSPEIRRLLTVPGVALKTAACFVAAVGDIGRFARCANSSATSAWTRASAIRQRRRPSRSHQHGGLGTRARDARRGGLDRSPRPRDRSRRSSSASAARKGPQVAATATARKLACLFWCMLIRGEDYAYARPSMTRHKIRQLELACGAPSQKGRKGIAGNRSVVLREHERQLARQAEAAYRRTIADWRATGPAKLGASATSGRASSRPSKGKAARQTSMKPQRSALCHVSHPHPTRGSHPRPAAST